jgi:hypothetical protein
LQSALELQMALASAGVSNANAKSTTEDKALRLNMVNQCTGGDNEVSNKITNHAARLTA